MEETSKVACVKILQVRRSPVEITVLCHDFCHADFAMENIGGLCAQLSCLRIIVVL